MTKATQITEELRRPMTTEEHLDYMNEMMFIVLPMRLVKALSDEAAKRNMTMLDLMTAAIDEYVKKPQPPARLG